MTGPVLLLVLAYDESMHAQLQPQTLTHPARYPSRRSAPLQGVLWCLDGYMNIAMEQTEEYANGQLKAKYGDCFIRGNNGEGGGSCSTARQCRKRSIMRRGKD